MSDISSSLHDDVVLRAGNRCEYCQLSQAGQEATFHVDHIVPRASGGATVAGNLRWRVYRALFESGRSRRLSIRNLDRLFLYSTRELKFGQSISAGMKKGSYR